MSGFSKKRGKSTENLTSKKGLVKGELEVAREIENADEGDGIEFEDPYGDDFAEEEFVETYDSEDDEEQGDGGEGGMLLDGVGGDDGEEQQEVTRVFRPGIDKVAEGEELERDDSAYVMYHALRMEWPCLSFDILRDSLGHNRQRFPHTVLLVTGSQADSSDKNKLTLLKLSDLTKTQQKPAKDEDDSSDEESSDEDDDEGVDVEPILEHVNAPHIGGVNRIRAMPSFDGVESGIVASMSDNGSVYIYDFRKVSTALMVKAPYPKGAIPTKPSFTFNKHSEEGFAIDWSPLVPGRLATGDVAGDIWVWADTASGLYKSQDMAAAGVNYKGHTSSVEDIQWSPTEPTVFASASSDKTIRVWDIRGRTGPQITIDAHLDDINVISWNRNVSYLLASGCDDGSFKVWDLRTIKSGLPMANFTYHKMPITSIEWAYHDESMLCVSGADDQVTIWDLSVEADAEEGGSGEGVVSGDLSIYPPQLLFIHQGQSNVKEVHFHPQIPGVILTTAEDGFNVFKPAINVV